jgi:hypothetical protein
MFAMRYFQRPYTTEIFILLNYNIMILFKLFQEKIELKLKVKQVNMIFNQISEFNGISADRI